MKKILLSLSAFALISTTVVASENMAKGLNVMLTSEDAQTQMMGMVLGGSVLNEQKKVLSITLCGPAGNLALKDSVAVDVKKPDGTVTNPKAALQGLIKAGAVVTVCPLFLPNAGKDTSALAEGITVAKPPMVAKSLTDAEFNNISF